MRLVSSAFVLALCLATAPGAARAQEAGPAVPAPSPAAAPTTSAPAQASEAAPVEPATLRVRGRAIIDFRVPALGYPPADRAENAKKRIEADIERGALGPVTVRPTGMGFAVEIGRLPAFFVQAGDGDGTPEVAARNAQANLERVLAEILEARSVRMLLRAIATSLAATLLFVIVLRVLFLLRRRVASAIERLTSREVGRLAQKGLRLSSTERVIAWERKAFYVLDTLVFVVFTYAWLAFVLRQFPQTRVLGEGLGRFFFSEVRSVLRLFGAAVPGLFTVLLIFVATRFIVSLASRFLDSVERGEVTLSWMHADTAAPTRRISTAVLWAFAVVLAYPYLPGSGSEAFKGVSVFTGLMLSLSGAALVSQALSGLVVMYARSMKEGDYVKIGDVEGTVISLGALAAKIRTTKQEEVTIPNVVLVSQQILNYSHAPEPGVLISASATIGYDTPWRQIHAMMEEAARRTPGLHHDPPPFTLQTALNDFYVAYEVRAVLMEPRSRVPVLSALHKNIQDVFNENGVQIMSPHYLGDPSDKKWVPKDRWWEAPAIKPPGT